MDSIQRLIEAIEKAGYEVDEDGAINTAAKHYEWIARRKELDNTVSQTVWGDVHMQAGIKMDIKLLEENIAHKQEHYKGTTLDEWHKGYLWGLGNSLALIKTQLKEFPWY